MVKEAPQWYGTLLPSLPHLTSAFTAATTVPQHSALHIRQFLLSRWPFLARVVHWLSQTYKDISQAPLEPILHYSSPRVRWAGFFMFTGHPLFALVWGVWLPQPWESFWLRGAVAMTGLLLLFHDRIFTLSGTTIQWVFSLVAWLQLPVFFSWMYLCNGGNTVWLASMVSMVLIYYHLTDWRLATLGTAAGGLVAWLLFVWIGPNAIPIADHKFMMDAAVLGFSWSAALVLGFSSANLRREHLKNTLATVGIMAHELRTPLATMSLIGEALMGNSRIQTTGAANSMNEKLGKRLQVLVHNMNHQIDTQIVNARLLNLPSHKEHVQAGVLIRNIVTDYPYRSAQERSCVVLQVLQDFTFEFSAAVFSQVMDNLIKNALKALAAADVPVQHGDLVITVDVWEGRGRVTVVDKGVGIAPHLQTHIFDAFFSTDRGTGHGLGLAFCRRAVQGAGGSIGVHSEPGKGATFTLSLTITGGPHAEH